MGHKKVVFYEKVYLNALYICVLSGRLSDGDIFTWPPTRPVPWKSATC